MSGTSPKQEEWQAVKYILRDLWLQKGMTTTTIRARMEKEHGFKASKSAYDRQFNDRWRWRKNLTAEEWHLVRLQINKRKRDSGKSSEVRLCGQVLPDAERKAKRHRLSYADEVRMRERKTQLPDDILVSTPMPMAENDTGAAEYPAAFPNMNEKTLSTRGSRAQSANAFKEKTKLLGVTSTIESMESMVEDSNVWLDADAPLELAEDLEADHLTGHLQVLPGNPAYSQPTLSQDLYGYNGFKIDLSWQSKNQQSCSTSDLASNPSTVSQEPAGGYQEKGSSQRKWSDPFISHSPALSRSLHHDTRRAGARSDVMGSSIDMPCIEYESNVNTTRRPPPRNPEHVLELPKHDLSIVIDLTESSENNAMLSNELASYQQYLKRKPSPTFSKVYRQLRQLQELRALLETLLTTLCNSFDRFVCIQALADSLTLRALNRSKQIPVRWHEPELLDGSDDDAEQTIVYSYDAPRRLAGLLYYHAIQSKSWYAASVLRACNEYVEEKIWVEWLKDARISHLEMRHNSCDPDHDHYHVFEVQWTVERSRGGRFRDGCVAELQLD